MEKLTIGRVAEAAGVPISTVRYYERMGLVRPSARNSSNYRIYSRADAERLRFIKAAQATGFTLDDVIELLRPARCSRVQDVIEQRLETVEARMRELRRVRRVLRKALATCHEHKARGRCAVIDELSGKARWTG